MVRASKFEDSREQILATLNQSQLQHGKPPAVRDLAVQFEVGVATMHSYLQKLAKEGMVEWRPGRHRTLHLTPAGLRELS
jgi:DNA-binding transcriptional regulator YhcF (GntR family)